MLAAGRFFILVFFVFGVACGAGDEARPADDGEPGPEPEEETTLLGDVTSPPRFSLIANRADGLNVPRDLGFHPEREGELWVVNRADDSVVIVFDATGDAKESSKFIDGYAMHFMEEVSSIAFGAKNFEDDYSFGTCQETENTYNGLAEPDFFMGPTLWSANLEVFAFENPIGLGSHLDMLHHSPNCMGIAHEAENAYWVFDGYHGKLVRYDFQEDHDAGYDDHSDGIIEFLQEPEVSRVEGVPSHLVLDGDSKQLYVADTGNSRILQVDTEFREFARSIPPIEQGTVVGEWRGAEWSEVVSADSGLLQRPSGIALHDGILYVGDNATGELFAFRLGEEDPEKALAGRLVTGMGAGELMGIEVGPDERLYLVDASGLVLRLER